MVDIIKETWERNGVEGKKWLNEKHIEIQLEQSDLPAVTLQYPSELKKNRITKLWQLSAL